MTSVPRAWALRLLFLAGVLIASPAAAEPEDLAIAEKLFAEGKREMAAGDYASACPKLAESRRLDRQIGITLYLAECYQQWGKLVAAWGLFRDAADAATAKGDPRAALARKRGEALEGRLSTVTIRIAPADQVPDLRIDHDRTPLPKARWNVALPVDRGEHVVSAEAPGRRAISQSYVIEREGQRVELAIPQLEEAPPAPATTTTPPAIEPRGAEPVVVEPRRDRGATRRIVGYGLLGVAATSLGVGAIYGLRAGSGADDAKQLCPVYPSCGAGAAGLAAPINESARSEATVSTIAFVVSGVALATAIVLFVTQ